MGKPSSQLDERKINLTRIHDDQTHQLINVSFLDIRAHPPSIQALYLFLLPDTHPVFSTRFIQGKSSAESETRYTLKYKTFFSLKEHFLPEQRNIFQPIKQSKNTGKR